MAGSRLLLRAEKDYCASDYSGLLQVPQKEMGPGTIFNRQTDIPVLWRSHRIDCPSIFGVATLELSPMTSLILPTNILFS